MPCRVAGFADSLWETVVVARHLRGVEIDAKYSDGRVSGASQYELWCSSEGYDLATSMYRVHFY